MQLLMTLKCVQGEKVLQYLPKFQQNFETLRVSKYLLGVKKILKKFSGNFEKYQQNFRKKKNDFGDL